MSSKPAWSSWCDIDYSSARHQPDIHAKAYYDSKPSKCLGGGCHMPAVEGMEDRLYLVDRDNPIPSVEDIIIEPDGITTGVSKEERLSMVRQWVATKTNELTIRQDARFATTLFIPVPNQLDARQVVRFGNELCRALFSDHQYSFTVHTKETVVRKQVTGGTVAEFARQNNHIHIMFSERSLATGKKGTGEARTFKTKDKLRQLVVTKSDEILAQEYGIKIRKANAGKGKKKRISRVQYQAKAREERLQLALEEAAQEVGEIRGEIDMLQAEFEALEREIAEIKSARNDRQDRRRQIGEAAKQRVLDRFAEPTGPEPVTKPTRGREGIDR